MFLLGCLMLSLVALGLIAFLVWLDGWKHAACLVAFVLLLSAWVIVGANLVTKGRFW